MTKPATKLTVIIDNTASDELLGEWGLSILVEYGDVKILADVGASELFAENLEKLGFHLFNKSNREVRKISKEIKKTGIEFVCTGHCTIDRAYQVMRSEMGDMVEQLRVGLVMNF